MNGGSGRRGRRITIPQGPTQSLRAFVSATKKWLPIETYALGGGTALAGRWRHRHSTDIDLFTDLSVYRRIMAESRTDLNEALGKLAGESAEDQHEVHRNWLGIPLVSGPVTLMTEPKELGDPWSDDMELQTGVALESSAEILTRKLQSRILQRGDFVPRDFYDFIVASKLDPGAWKRAIGTVGSEERRQIADHVESLPEKWVAEGRRVLNPAYPEVVTSLRSRSRMLLLKTENSGQRRGRTAQSAPPSDRKSMGDRER